MKDAKEGVAMLDTQFLHEKIDGDDYVFVPGRVTNSSRLQRTFLMPDYDEYGISYKNRSAIFKPNLLKKEHSEDNSYKHMIVIDGIIAGTWQQTMKNNNMAVEIAFFNTLNKRQHQAVQKAFKKYISFHEEGILPKD